MKYWVEKKGGFNDYSSEESESKPSLSESPTKRSSSVVATEPADFLEITPNVSEINFIPQKSPLESLQEENAALLIQRVGHGLRTRKSYITPEKLKNKIVLALEAAGIHAADPDGLSKAIAAEILSSTDPSYQGYGKFVTRDNEKPNPIEFWVSRNENKARIKLIGEELAEGAKKKVHKAQEIEIELLALTPSKVSKPKGFAAVRFNASHARSVLSGQKLILERLQNSPDLEYFAVDLGETDRFYKPVQPQPLTGHSDENSTLSGALLSVSISSGDNNLEFTHMVDAKDRLYEGSFHSFYGSMLIKNHETYRYEINKEYFEYLDEEIAAGEELESSETYRTHIKNCLSDTAKGLQALHRVGLVHTDIKPANIFILPDGEEVASKIGDLDGVTVLGNRPGALTLAYADELSKIKGVATPFADIYPMALMAKDYLIDNMPEKLKKLVDDVISANEKTLDWFDSKAGIPTKQKLNNENESVRLEGLVDLNAQFPQFNELLSALTNLPNLK